MPPNTAFHNWIFQIPILLFVFSFGACVGSFINVLAYRLPRGLDVVMPTSRCPKCEHKLGWRENFPILGWLWLRGRCRFCKDSISPEYPIVETIVALLFASLYALWYMQPSPIEFLGAARNAAAPGWVISGGWAWTWPGFTIMLALVGSLVAMTIIDAKTFTIPLAIPWILGFFSILAHTGHAVWVQLAAPSRLTHAGWDWSIPTGGWEFTIGALAGGVGLIVSAALLSFGLIPRSFDDYEEWEKSVTEKTKTDADGDSQKESTQATEPAGESAGSLLVRVLLFTGPIIVLMFIGAAIGAKSGRFAVGMLIGGAIGAIIGVILRQTAPEDEPDENDPIWTQYPHARREVLKEMLFLAPIAIAIAAGVYFAGGIAGPHAQPPLWMRALGGSLMGVLAGGGVVWVIRILGSLAFGKEAIGLGDVHMMAGVGAAIGWVDPVLAFFIAPFSGIAFAIGSTFFARLLKTPRVLPYGPHLAVATLFILYAKPVVERALTALSGQPINLP